jgi:hypothetical protein
MDAGGKFGRYQDNDTEDYDDSWFKVDGKRELSPENAFFGKAGISMNHENRDSKESVQVLDELTTYQATELEGGVRHERRDRAFRLGVSSETLDYDDVGALNNDDRDRTTTGAGIRLSQAVSQQNRIYLQGQMNQRNYDQSLDDAGYDRDSDGYSAALGVTHAFSGGGKVDVYAGALSQDYDDARFDTVTEVDFGGSLHWYPSQTVKVLGSLKKSIRETTEPGASGYLLTLTSLQVEKKLVTDVHAYVTYGHGLAEYQSSEREDNYDTYGIGLKYFMSPRVYLSGGYSHITYDSNDQSSLLAPGDSYDFDRDIFQVSLQMRLAPVK